MTGERNPNGRLTWAQVREVRRRWADRKGGPSMAKELGVHMSTIYSIVYNRTWREH